MFASSVLDHGFQFWSEETKYYKIDICYFFDKYAALRSKSKDWMDLNQYNVSKWSDISACGLLFQWASTIKIQLSMLVLYKADIIISSECNLFLPWHSWKIIHLALNNNNSLTHEYMYMNSILLSNLYSIVTRVGSRVYLDR